ncbi:hypothetical protein OVA06_19545 [Pseudarthrobacter sp. SL88]|uniref:hypothetical protein n=1 Tax=Pseudarthrobacter sp. SL88 TaxID=2994666 RepID=UPI0022760052|nr:hypothetical protein [Pseudarthrobacter sp. SL88]MCY1676868.1 hypothetical protein [Pseudarthrobacter sp. SL88]
MTPNGPLSIQTIGPQALPRTTEAMEELLKEHYYRVDPAEYFERRLWGIVALADMKSGAVNWDSADGDSLFAQFKGVLKNKRIALDVPPGETLSSRTMASIESYTLMQHVIETALRLFVASEERVTGSSLMLKLVNMRNATEFRNALRPLLGPAARHKVQTVMFPPQLRGDESAETKQEMKQHLAFLTEWLSFFARFYSDDKFNGAQGNNQLKHGATASPRADLGVVLHIADEPPQNFSEDDWEAAAAIVNAESVSYVVQERGAKDTVPGLNLRTDNSDPATNLAIAQVGITIVRSLWQMSQVVAFPNTARNYEYDYSPMPNELFEATTKPPRAVVQPLLKPAPRQPQRGQQRKRRR